MQKPDKTTALQVIGGIVAFGVTAASVALSPRYPWVGTIASLVCWWIGKALGIPLERVTQTALQYMQPERVAEIAVKAIQSMPPERTATATQRIIASIHPPGAPTRRSAGIQIIPDPHDEEPTL